MTSSGAILTFFALLLDWYAQRAFVSPSSQAPDARVVHEISAQAQNLNFPTRYSLAMVDRATSTLR